MMMLIKLILATIVFTICDALEKEACDCDNTEIVSSDRRTVRYGGGWYKSYLKINRHEKVGNLGT